MDIAYIYGEEVTRPTLRIINMVVFALALASAVLFQWLWIHRMMTMHTQLTLTAVSIVVVGLCIGGEGLLRQAERRSQRGFRVILKDQEQK